MENSVFENTAQIVGMLNRFLEFVYDRDKRGGEISFRDVSGFLGREEDFKSVVVERAREQLRIKDWKESWIGSGKIAVCAAKAIASAGILVDRHQKTDFIDRLNPKHPGYKPEAEKVLYDIFVNPHMKEEEAFKNATKVFGAKYDTISYFFYLKDDTRFLPVRPKNVDASFELLGIDYITNRCCSWKNYQGYLEILKGIYELMEDILPIQGKLRYIDAHSFVWVINENCFRDWKPGADVEAWIEQRTEDYALAKVTGNGGLRARNYLESNRSAKVVKETRKRARGICGFCGQPAPFKDKHGEPYLEVHHIEWLSRGGEDSTDNTVALCPNCHTRMHILDDPKDIEFLKRKK